MKSVKEIRKIIRNKYLKAVFLVEAQNYLSFIPGVGKDEILQVGFSYQNNSWEIYREEGCDNDGYKITVIDTLI